MIARAWLGLCVVVFSLNVAVPARAEGLRQYATQTTDILKLIASNPAQAVTATLALEADALKTPGSLQSRETVVTARWLRAEALIQLARIDEASDLIEAALKALSPSQRSAPIHADLLMARASLGTMRGNASQTLVDAQSAFRIYGRLANPASQARALLLIGTTYQNAGDYRRALDYYQQGDELSRNPALNLVSINNQGDAFAALGEFANAERRYRSALALAQQLRNPLLQARILDNIARTQIRAGRFGNARTTLATGLALTRTPAAAEWRPVMLGTAANLAFSEGRTAEAGRLLKVAVPIINASNTLQQYSDLHKVAHQVFKRLGDQRRALAHFEAYSALDREGRELASSFNASLTSARFDFANQNARIATLKAGQLKRDIALERLQARQAAVVLGALLAVVTLIAAMLTLYLRSLRRSRAAIQRANASLADSNTQLESALLAKSEFLATTSHEIRTPLNGVLGMTQVLLEDKSVNAEARERLLLLHGAGVAMRDLVDDLLQLAKLDVGIRTVAPERVDIHRLLRNSVALWEDEAARKALSLKLDLGNTPRWLIADPAALRQILSNLLSNALKFTEAGSVEVAASVSSRGTHETLEISVTDTGIGVPAAALERIFDKFQQVDSSTTRRYGGTGLGLAIAREFALATGGELRVKSALGDGSTFTLAMPLERSVAEAPAAAGEPASSNDRTLCLVGFKPIARSVLDNVLAAHFARRTSADNLAMLDLDPSQKIDIAIIDGSTLLETDATATASARALREREFPSIILCAAVDFDAAQHRFGSSATLIVAKPVSGEVLLEHIARVGAAESARLALC